MKYLKTYEQVKDFYTGSEKLYLTVTEDENYIIFDNTTSLHETGTALDTGYKYVLLPIEELDALDVMEFTSDKEKSEWLVKTISSYYIGIKASDYIKNPVPITTDSLDTDVGDGDDLSARIDMFRTIFSDDGKSKYTGKDLDKLIRKLSLENGEGSRLHKLPDDELRKLFQEVIHDTNYNDKIFLKTRKMKFKSIEFIVGLGKNTEGDDPNL